MIFGYSVCSCTSATGKRTLTTTHRAPYPRAAHSLLFSFSYMHRCSLMGRAELSRRVLHDAVCIRCLHGCTLSVNPVLREARQPVGALAKFRQCMGTWVGVW